jgi:hypothetical protein
MTNTADFLRSQSSSSEDEDEGANGAAVPMRARAFSFTTEEYEHLQVSYNAVKAELSKLAEKLGMMCAVYKDMQIARLVKLRIAATSNYHDSCPDLFDSVASLQRTRLRDSNDVTNCTAVRLLGLSSMKTGR